MSCSGDCKAPSWPGKAVSFWKGNGLSDGAAHLLSHRHGLFAREKCKLEQNHSHTSLLHPMPHPMVLGVVCPHHGNSWGIRAASHVVGTEGKQGIFMNSCLLLLSHVLLVVRVHSLTYKHILRGKGGWVFIISFPYRKEWGQGEGRVE